MAVRLVSLQQPPRRLVLLKPSALGDIMHSLPVLAALRSHFPGTHLAWVVNRIYEPILRHHPDLDEVIVFDRQLLRGDWLGGGAKFAQFLGELRARRFDMAIDLQGLLRTGLMSWASGARVRLGLASAREGARHFYTHRVDDLHGVEHAVDRYCRVAEALGAATEPRVFRLALDAQAEAWALAALRDLPRPWLAVGVGARWLTKRWPPHAFAALIRRAQRRYGGTAVFVGAPDEAELAQQAARLVEGPACQLAGATNLAQLTAVLRQVDVLVANDTGPLHLAVALGRPVISPFTCTTVGRTGPYGQARRAVETKVACQGSYLKQCDRMECMAELTPERLWPALEEVLGAWQTNRRAG